MAMLSVNISSIESNLSLIKAAADRNNLELVAVVKPCHDFGPVLKLFDGYRPAYLGMSKIQIAKAFRHVLQSDILITSLPPIAKVDDVVQHSKVSVHSDPKTIIALNAAAERYGVSHGYFLMVDIGDLREGLLPHDVKRVLKQIHALDLKSLVFMGLGTNYACANGVQPTAENLNILYSLAKELRDEGIMVPKISLGGSSILEWLDSEILQAWPTQIRVGQAALLGTIPVRDLPGVGLRTDTLRFQATVLEVLEKPSVPVGTSGADALGDVHDIRNLGYRKRAILDFGVVDADPRALIPRDPGISIVTANSDYTIVDVTASEQELSVGSPVYFDMKYRAMLQGFLSPYLPKQIVTSL